MIKQSLWIALLSEPIKFIDASLSTLSKVANSYLPPGGLLLSSSKRSVESLRTIDK